MSLALDSLTSVSPVDGRYNDKTAPLREPGHPFNSFILAKTPANRWGTTQDLKGPAIFLAQFAGDKAPFNSLDAICQWVSSLGYKGIQTTYLPTSTVFTRNNPDSDEFNYK